MSDQMLTPEIARDSAIWYQEQMRKRGASTPPPPKPGSPTAAGSTHPADAAAAAAGMQDGMYSEQPLPGMSPPRPKPPAAPEKVEELTEADIIEVKEPGEKAAEADATRRTTARLNADRVGLNDKKAMLEALRGAQDLGAMRKIFEERTGQKMDDWVKSQMGGEEKEEDKKLNQKEAEALLSGDRKNGIDAAMANCGKRDKDKLKSILASCNGDPELIQYAKLTWSETHGGD